MAWTYDENPSSVPRDAVRLLIGDTDTTDQQLSDGEIAFYLAEEDSTYAAAVQACYAIAAKYVRLTDKSVGDLRISYSQRQIAYKELAKFLIEKAGMSQGMMYAGGISVDDKQDTKEETDRVQPAFNINRFKHPKTPDRSKTSRPQELL